MLSSRFPSATSRIPAASRAGSSVAANSCVRLSAVVGCWRELNKWKQLNTSYQLPSNQKIKRPRQFGPVSTGCAQRAKSWPLWRKQEFAIGCGGARISPKPPSAWQAAFFKEIPLPTAPSIRFAFSNTLQVQRALLRCRMCFKLGRSSWAAVDADEFWESECLCVFTSS